MHTYLYTIEQLEELQQEYEFVSKTLAFATARYNSYFRNEGTSIHLDAAIKNLTTQKIELAFKIDMVTDFLSS